MTKPISLSAQPLFQGWREKQQKGVGNEELFLEGVGK
jgi:hypothetical protein